PSDIGRSPDRWSGPWRDVGGGSQPAPAERRDYFSSFNLILTMSALENVTLSVMFAGVDRTERDQRGRAAGCDRTCRPYTPQVQSAFGRRATTCRDFADACKHAAAAAGRRAHRQSGQQDLSRDYGGLEAAQ